MQLYFLKVLNLCINMSRHVEMDGNFHAVIFISESEYENLVSLTICTPLFSDRSCGKFCVLRMCFTLCALY